MRPLFYRFLNWNKHNSPLRLVWLLFHSYLEDIFSHSLSQRVIYSGMLNKLKTVGIEGQIVEPSTCVRWKSKESQTFCTSFFPRDLSAKYSVLCLVSTESRTVQAKRNRMNVMTAATVEALIKCPDSEYEVISTLYRGEDKTVTNPKR